MAGWEKELSLALPKRRKLQVKEADRVSPSLCWVGFRDWRQYGGNQKTAGLGETGLSFWKDHFTPSLHIYC